MGQLIRQQEHHDEASLRLLISELLILFYNNGWVTGTGGGISAAFEDTALANENPVLMAPTGVHKERIQPEDFFVVNGKTGCVIRAPKNSSLRLSECGSIFCQIMNQRGAGSVMHSHGLSTILAGDLATGEDFFLIESLEMLKGIAGENNRSRHLVPVIQNTMYERELVQSVQEALDRPDSSHAYCLLVRDHGAYIWGKDIWEAKRHAEAYHFLFEAMIARKKMSALK